MWPPLPGGEAFLAVMALFVVHFFNNHIRPTRFPLGIVMFSGSRDLEEFKEERPEAYRRLVESGELEKYLVARGFIHGGWCKNQPAFFTTILSKTVVKNAGWK